VSAPDPSELAEVLGYRFARPDRLLEALTHPSVAGEGGAYERLEFLGYRVLALVVADLLFQAFPEEAEGALAKRHADLVRGDTLARVARRIGLGRHLRLASAERAAGGAERSGGLADALEAVIGALYYDGGFEAAASFVRREWEPLARGAATPPQDAKTALQELTQARLGALPSYRLLSREGPAHAPRFVVEAGAAGLAAQGTGASKRAAEQAAAEALLAKLGARSP